MNRMTVFLIVAVLAIAVIPYCHGQESSETAPTTKANPRSIDELLLFFPSKFPSGDWKPKDLQFEDVFFTAEDETKLHGWYCPANNPRAVVLIAHGNEDRTIPFSSGEKLFRSANEPKQFVTIEHADHNNWLTDAYLKQLDGFLVRVSGARK